MITEDYVSFEIAKLLRRKGFDGRCRDYYNTDGHFYSEDFKSDWNHGGLGTITIFSAPTIQMAMKWLREVHNIGIFPTTFYRHTKTFDGHNYGCTLVNLKTFDLIGNFEDCTFPADSYEEACEAAIKYCLENLIYV